MSSESSGACWRRHRIPAAVVAVFLARHVGGSRRRRAPIAPQVRGNVTPRVVDALERRGWHVHRIGAAVYVHAAGEHLIFGVWPRRSPRPSWAARLGAASAGWARRFDRMALEQRWRHQHRDRAGRFGPVMPWTRWPTPALYSWDPAGPSVAEEIDRLERVNRWRCGLLGDVAESELRLLDGNR